MRRAPRLLGFAAAIFAVACASCGPTAPARTSVTGRWTGSTVVGTEQWIIDMIVAEQNDSLHGTGTLRSVPARVNLDEVVTGRVTADSVQLLLRTIEDADIHMVVNVSPDQLSGRLWMNDFTNDPHAIVFQRQASP